MTRPVFVASYPVGTYHLKRDCYHLNQADVIPRVNYDRYDDIDPCDTCFDPMLFHGTHTPEGEDTDPPEACPYPDCSGDIERVNRGKDTELRCHACSRPPKRAPVDPDEPWAVP